MIKRGSKWSTLTNFRTQQFWPTGRPVVRGPGARSKAKIKRGSSRFTWGGGKFKPPHASFVDQTQGLIVWKPSVVVGDKEKKGKEERRERKRREKEKKRKASVLALVLAERNHQDNLGVLQLFKVISWDLFPSNLRSMCWNVKYFDFPIYFLKKVIAFVV